MSSAFLTSLSVTVLLVYVMNPPVRPAVQGAYFVAAFMTGLIFGAGSLIFKEVTEGLGCLLGGFCLSMWLLALRPGGTISSTGGKVILIAAFTVAAYALSFSHYTRPYGLIGATSFAGATAAVLGFDCFSRAGLKEFWLYIWNLNDNLFPLHTDTYPITRGIRVELAFIFLICFLGVISQLKLWKVVKDRRDKKDANRLEAERDRGQMEEAIGRRLEEGNERERAEWEAVYGGQDGSKRNTHTDSGLGTEENNSLRKASVSVQELEGASSPSEVTKMMEAGPVNNEQANNSLGEAGMAIRSITEDAVGARLDCSKETPSNSPGDLDGPQHAVEMAADSNARPTASEPSCPTLSPVGPLCFTDPSAEKPLVGAHMERLSDNGEDAISASQLDEENVDPNTFHSKGSSLAATVDDDWGDLDLVGHGQEDPKLAEIKSPPEALMPPEAVILPGFGLLQPEEDGKVSQSAKGLPTHPPMSAADDSDPEEFQRPIQAASKPQPAQNAVSSNHDSNGVLATTPASPSRPGVPESQTEDSQAQDSTPKSNKRLSLGAVSSTDSLTKGALARVPSQLSHVVLSYRTNEWAKHISTADEPEFDEPEMVAEGEEEFPAHLIERPAPVDVEELQQTATTAANPPPVAQRPTSSIPGLAPAKLNSISLGKSNTPNSNFPSGRSSIDSTARPENFQVCNSQLRHGKVSVADLTRSASAASPPLSLATRGLRSSSTSLPGHNLKASPIDENAEADFQPPAPCISPLPIAGSTLLAQRDSLLRNKQYNFTTRNTASPTEMMYSQPPIRSASRLSWIEEAGPRSASRLSLSAINDEDMPLSQRKSLIEQQAVTLLPEIRLAATNNPDAHPSQGSASAVTAQKRESMLASWRQSMRQDIALTSVPKETVETRRAEMLIEKRQFRMTRDYSAATKIYQENAFAQAVTRGDMQELHKEAMRKMQANANKHIS